LCAPAGLHDLRLLSVDSSTRPTSEFGLDVIMSLHLYSTRPSERTALGVGVLLLAADLRDQFEKPSRSMLPHAVMLSIGLLVEAFAPRIMLYSPPKSHPRGRGTLHVQIAIPEARGLHNRCTASRNGGARIDTQTLKGGVGKCR